MEWITFDCYGTLIDWEGGVAAALAPFLPPPVDGRALAAQYIALEAETEAGPYRSYRDVLADTSSRLMARLGHPLPAGQARVLPDSLPGWLPFPEVPMALQDLRRAGYRMAILSNVDRDLLAASVARLGMAPDLVVTAEDCRSYKPEPGHWVYFQAHSGAAPGRTVHVGASVYHDMAPAASLGYRTVFINRRGDPVTGARPTRVLPDLGRLPETIRDLARAP